MSLSVRLQTFMTEALLKQELLKLKGEEEPKEEPKTEEKPKEEPKVEDKPAE